MRVIAGEKRGTKLISLEGKDTRPTTDRVKESLFNILQWDIEGRLVLDLFAGSGSLGLEALSRGAAHAMFVDANAEAVAVIQSNIQKLRFEGKSKIICTDFQNALKNCKIYDIIFLDPPYQSNFLDISLDLIYKNVLLSSHGVIICETDKNKQIHYEGFKIKKEVCYGNTKLCFLELGGIDG